MVAMGETRSAIHNPPLTWEGDVPCNVTLRTDSRLGGCRTESSVSALMWRPTANRAAEIIENSALWRRRVTFRVTLVPHHRTLERPSTG
jgi:hypothetical protein